MIRALRTALTLALLFVLPLTSGCAVGRWVGIGKEEAKAPPPAAESRLAASPTTTASAPTAAQPAPADDPVRPLERNIDPPKEGAAKYTKLYKGQMRWFMRCPDRGCTIGEQYYDRETDIWRHPEPEVTPATQPAPSPKPAGSMEVPRDLKSDHQGTTLAVTTPTWGTEAVMCPQFLWRHTEKCIAEDRKEGAGEVHEYLVAYNPAFLKKRQVPKGSVPIFWSDQLSWSATPMKERLEIPGDTVKVWPAITLTVTNDTKVRFTGAFGDPKALDPENEWQWLELNGCIACTHHPGQDCEVRAEKGRIFHVPCTCEACKAKAAAASHQ